MSMVINLVEDHNIYLCEGGPVYNGGVQPPPITYLTQWKIVGNSEVHGNEIWSCGEYSEVDKKRHIRILPEGYGIVDIALDEPLRKVNDVADSIEFADGVATVTRNIASVDMRSLNWTASKYPDTERYRYNVYSLRGIIKLAKNNNTPGDILCTIYNTTTANGAYAANLEGIAVDSSYCSIYLYDANYNQEGDLNAFLEHIQGAVFIYALATPTTEVIQVPHIQEAESYSCVISQGGKAVEWSSFETNSE